MQCYTANAVDSSMPNYGQFIGITKPDMCISYNIDNVDFINVLKEILKYWIAEQCRSLMNVWNCRWWIDLEESYVITWVM